MKYDVAIIGGGPGGYTAAAAAAGEGLSVILFEYDFLGGTCLNRGCMPTKALLHAAEVYKEAKEGDKLGLRIGDVGYDFAALHERKNEVVAQLRDGIAKLMKAGKVTVVNGKAQIAGEGIVTCDGETYEAGDIIIATGSVPSFPPIEGSPRPICA